MDPNSNIARIWQKKEVKDEELVAYVADWRRRLSGPRLRRMQDWMLNDAFYQGNHYVRFDSTSNSIQPLTRDNAQRNLVRITLSILKPAIEAQINRLTRDRPRLNTIPESDDHIKIDAARYSDKVLNATWEKQGVDRKLRRSLYNMKIFGNGWLKCRWNPDLGMQLPGETTKDGDIGITLPRSPDMWLSDGYDDIEDLPEIAEIRMLNKDFVASRWPKVTFDQSHLTTDTDIDGTDYRRQIMHGGRGIQKESTDQVDVIEYYRKPDKVRPKGVFAIIVNGQVAHRDDNVGIPTPGHYYPYVTFQDMQPNYTLWSESTMTQLRDPMKALERLVSSMQESMNGNGTPRLIINPRTLVGGRKSISNDPSALVEWTGIGEKPNWIPGAPVSSTMLQLVNFYIEMIREIADYQNVRSGDHVEGVRAESHYSALVAQNDLKLIQNLNSMAWGLETLGHMISAEVNAHYDEGRMLNIAGPQGEAEVFAFKKSAASKSTTVKFHLSTFAATNNISQISQALKLYEAGVFTQLHGPKDDMEAEKKGAQTLIKLISLDGDIERPLTSDALNQTAAQWENKQFEELATKLIGAKITQEAFAKQIPMAYPEHDHKIHNQEHTLHMLSLPFLKLLNDKSDVSRYVYKVFSEHMKTHDKEGHTDDLEDAQNIAEVSMTASGGMMESPEANTAPMPQEATANG